MAAVLDMSAMGPGEKRLWPFVAGSMVLHAAVVLLSPHASVKEPPPPRFTATIRAIDAPAPRPAEQAPAPQPAPEPPSPQVATPPPEPPKPVQQRPEPPAPKPDVRPETRTAPVMTAPAATPSSAPAVAAPAPEARNEPRAEAKPEREPAKAAPAAAPASAPASPPATAEVQDRDLVAQYQSQLAGIIETRKLKRYPNEAMQNGWEGVSTVVLKVGSDGKIAGVETVVSSGHEMLDEQARISISKAKPFVQVPEGLRGKPFEARVRVVFSLKN
jgi:protein TonB